MKRIVEQSDLRQPGTEVKAHGAGDAAHQMGDEENISRGEKGEKPKPGWDRTLKQLGLVD